MNVAAPLRDLANRSNDLFVGGFLEDVAMCPRRESLPHVTRIVLHREDQDFRLRRLFQKLRQYLDAAFAGHDDVEQDDVRLERASPKDRVLCISGLADHLDVILSVQEQTDARANDSVVVDEDDADHSGTSATSVAPEPGVDSTVNRPSCNSTRSRMPMIPMPSSRSSAGSKPCPSSSITTVAVPVRRTRRMLTRDA